MLDTIGYWMVFGLVLLLPCIALINNKKVNDPVEFPENSYLKESFIMVAIIVVLSMTGMHLWDLPDFDTVGRGSDQGDLGTLAITVSLFLLLIAFTKWTPYYPKKKEEVPNLKELYGLPVNYLPNSSLSFAYFSGTIVTAVIFEELVYRLFLFNALWHLFGIGGDWLVLITSIFFAFAHTEYNWAGKIPVFFSGLICGKVYLIEGSIYYPMAIHLIQNMVVLVLAYRRLRDLKSLGLLGEKK